MQAREKQRRQRQQQHHTNEWCNLSHSQIEKLFGCDASSIANAHSTAKYWLWIILESAFFGWIDLQTSTNTAPSHLPHHHRFGCTLLFVFIKLCTKYSRAMLLALQPPQMPLQKHSISIAKMYTVSSTHIRFLKAFPNDAPRSICHYSATYTNTYGKRGKFKFHMDRNKWSNFFYIHLCVSLFFGWFFFRVLLRFSNCLFANRFVLHIEHSIEKKFIKFQRCTCAPFSMQLLFHSIFSSFFLGLQYRRRVSWSTDMFATSKATNAQHLY